VLPGEVRGIGHNEDDPVAGREVAALIDLRLGEAEDPLLAERDGDDEGVGDHVPDAVTVRPGVVAKVAIVPIQEQAVEPGIDRPAGSTQERHEVGRDGQGGVGPPSVAVIGPVGLLPAGYLDRLAVHLDDVRVLRVEGPECLEPGRVRAQLPGEPSDEEVVAVV